MNSNTANTGYSKYFGQCDCDDNFGVDVSSYFRLVGKAKRFIHLKFSTQAKNGLTCSNSILSAYAWACITYTEGNESQGTAMC
jgi:hypothetical protein